MPAHWGALAQSVEAFGVPAAAAGGSSASVSTFLLESVLLNPALSAGERALQVSFLLKSFQGFWGIWLDQPEWKALVALVGALGAGEAKGIELLRALARAGSAGGTKELKLLRGAVDDLVRSGVFAGPAVTSLLESLREWERNPSQENIRLVRRRAAAAKAALAVLGSFDAKGDADLFVREGIVSFPDLARLFGRMADFYSMRGASPRLVGEVSAYLDRCATGSAGLDWSEIVARDSGCQAGLAQLAQAYRAEGAGKEFRVHERVGEYLPVLISTAVAGGEAARDLKRRQALYRKGEAPDLSPIAGEIGFGYWGQSNDLERVADALRSQALSSLDKSRRFRALGQVSWLEALSLSPAEPGLASFLPVSGDLVSLGGWSDLHPVPVLRALGCEKVVYLTRSGGDSLFGQGVAKRLLGLPDVSWTDLDPSRKEARVRNNRGVAGAVGPWSAMYNLANPTSSFAASLAMADAVVCTDWDAFAIGGGIEPMVAQAYRAPVYLAGDAVGAAGSAQAWAWAVAAPKLVRASDNRVDPALGFSPLAGCIPFPR